jgi:hypothetical protein
MRVLIAWLYTQTRSVLLAQLMHVSSTGSLVVFSAPRVNAAQEVFWYVVYGIALWIVAAVVVRLAVRRTGEPVPLLQDPQRRGSL